MAKERNSFDFTPPKVQVIKGTDGKTEWVLVRPDDYDRLLEALENLEDVEAVRQAEMNPAYPAKVAHHMLDGRSPLYGWRQFRGLNQGTLAVKVGISQAYLSQLEKGEREGSVEIWRNLAKALGADVAEILPWDDDEDSDEPVGAKAKASRGSKGVKTTAAAPPRDKRRRRVNVDRPMPPKSKSASARKIRRRVKA